MKSSLLAILSLLLLSSAGRAQQPSVNLLGPYHVLAYAENGKNLSTSDYGAIRDCSSEFENRARVYCVSFQMGDKTVLSIDTIGMFEASYLGISFKDVVVQRNDISSRQGLMTIDARIRLPQGNGSCERTTTTVFQYTPDLSTVAVRSTMSLCNGQTTARELRMSKL